MEFGFAYLWKVDQLSSSMDSSENGWTVGEWWEIWLDMVGRPYVPVSMVCCIVPATARVRWTTVHVFYGLPSTHTLVGHGLDDACRSKMILHTHHSNLVFHTHHSKLVYNTLYSTFVYHTLHSNLVSIRLSSNLVLDRVNVS